MSTLPTIQVISKKNSKWYDCLLLLIVWIGLYCLGVIITFIFIGIKCYIDENSFSIELCYYDINYWLLCAWAPIIGIIICIIYLCVSDLIRRNR